MRFQATVALWLAGGWLFAQQPAGCVNDSVFLAGLAGVDMQGKFAVKAAQDESSSYFVLDFSKLPARFERVWFMNLTFGSGKLVNLAPDLRKDRLLFKASNSYPAQEILDVFSELKEKTVRTASEWTEPEKDRWLSSNDKYK